MAFKYSSDKNYTYKDWQRVRDSTAAPPNSPAPASPQPQPQPGTYRYGGRSDNTHPSMMPYGPPIPTHTTAPTLGVTGPQLMPPGYGYYYPPGAVPMPAPASFAPGHHGGGIPISGRTATEVAYDEMVQAARTADAARLATEKFKPDAKPEDMFWVWEKDHASCHQYSFATICSWDDGRWHIDAASGIAYYVREQKEKKK